MGSMNFGLFPMLKRFRDFAHDWEAEMLASTERPCFSQYLQGHRVHAIETLNGTGTRYEFECYDTSHLYNLHYF